MTEKRPDMLATMLLVIVVTALRVGVLAATPTDLFLDEAQYWAWSQDFEWGYFSKPPLIAVVIGAITALAGSDAEFWVRLAAPFFHGATALILAGWIRGVDRDAAFWVAAIYLSMPILTIGSWVISTDTVMVPFLAGALWAWWRHLETGAFRFAIIAGALAGMATLGKYAGAYFWLGVIVAAIFPAHRPGLRGLGAAILAFGLVIAPNIIWNIQNGLVTFTHIADNAHAGEALSADWASLAEFLASQAFVIGPVFFVVWLAGTTWSRTPIKTYLLAFSVPILLLVAYQAWSAEANANWAFAAYPAAAVFVGLHLAQAVRRRWLHVGLGANAVIVLAATAIILWPGLAPQASDRYMARTSVMVEVIERADNRPLIAEGREILADLVYAAGRWEVPVEVYSLTTDGPPRHWYDMAVPKPEGAVGLYVTTGGAPRCLDAETVPEITITPETGAYRGRTLSLFALPPGC